MTNLFRHPITPRCARSSEPVLSPPQDVRLPFSGPLTDLTQQEMSHKNETDGSFGGILEKWGGYICGWRHCWFSVEGGYLLYSRTVSRKNGRNAITREEKPAAISYLKVAGFRESKLDARKFFVFSSTKTLELKAFSNEDRSTWINALAIARDKSPKYSFIPNNISFSSNGLRDHLHAQGIGENLIKECEDIMLMEFANYLKHPKTRKEPQEATFIETSTPNSTSNDIPNMANLDPTEDSEEIYYDASDNFTLLPEPKEEGHGLTHANHTPFEQNNNAAEASNEMLPHVMMISNLPGQNDETVDTTSEMQPSVATINNVLEQNNEIADATNEILPVVARRSKLPEPREKEKAISLWSVIKDCIGKETASISLPVCFHEPLSSLQKVCEEFEYSHLLDEACQHGKMGNNIMRVMKVASFIVASYSFTEGRSKPFNPMLGETFEAEFPEKGIRFISEKVSHRPVKLACHCEGKGWTFYGDSTLKSKFRGPTIQFDPVGTLTLEFEDGEVFTWSKDTTTINNLIMGKPNCNHYGTMHIKGNRGFSCKLKFKEQSLLNSMPRQVQGLVEDSSGNKVASLIGEWNDNLRYEIVKSDHSNQSQDEESLLWKRNEPQAGPSRYNLSPFGVTLNELTPALQENLPCTDSRLRMDIRHLENGEYDKATSEKTGWSKGKDSRNICKKPRWFQQDGADGTYKYNGGYWEAKRQNSWHGCPKVFEDISDYNTNNSE